MSVCRHTSRVYCDVDDLDGCLNALSQAVGESDDSVEKAFLKGAYYTFLILRHHEWVDTQADFMAVLRKYYGDEFGR